MFANEAKSFVFAENIGNSSSALKLLPLSIVTYKLTSELYSTGAGLVSAAMIAIVPGYISRSVAGSYDNEGIAIFCMLLTYYLW